MTTNCTDTGTNNISMAICKCMLFNKAGLFPASSTSCMLYCMGGFSSTSSVVLAVSSKLSSIASYMLPVLIPAIGFSFAPVSLGSRYL